MAFKKVESYDKWSVLAGLWFFLALIVVFLHLQEQTSVGLLSFMALFGGFEAVLGFLLVSGYSVTTSYLKRPAGFFWRRLQRLYPVYLTSLVLTVIATVFVAGKPMPSAMELLLNALFLNQLLIDHSILVPAWSLSLEFWLYCLAPVLVAASLKAARTIMYVSFASYLVYTACRTLLHLPYHAETGYGGNLLVLAFVWVCGLRLARERKQPACCMWDLRLIFSLHIIFISAIQLAYRIKHHAIAEFFHEDAIPFVMQAATLCLVYLVFSRWVLSDRGSRRRSSLLSILGDVSYPLYLVHMPVFIALKKWRVENPFIYLFSAFALAILVYLLIDFYPRRHHARVAQPLAVAA